MTNATYPISRMRRLRSSEALRNMVQENRVHVHDLILPIFVEENVSERTPVKSLPGVFRETEETLAKAVQEAYGLGIQSVILFGVSHNKDDEGRDSLKSDGLLARMIKRAKDAAPEIAVIADACFCEYTDHGHCGPIGNNRDVDNDRTLDNLKKQTITAANAGADIIAPSGMMDGMVAAIREGLDSKGHHNIPILSYAAKFASSFYGPFRDAAGCSLENAPSDLPKDRKTYQMNPANSDEALREVEIDLQEGADMVMVKPGLPYLDIITRVKDRFKVPTFAYHVSGEYAMLKAASQNGWLDYDSTLMETLLAFKRAGCDSILTYGALDCARLLQD